MAELATLSLAIDSRSAVEATSAIDRMGEAAARGEGKVKQILAATDSLVAALNRNTTATAALSARMDQMGQSGAKATDAIKSVATTAVAAEASVTDLAQGLERVGAAATTSARAIDASAASAQKHVTATAQVSAATAKATGAHNDNAKAVGLSANELRNLGFQLNDVTTMALSGASAFQIAATQGGQLLQIAQSAEGGVKGLLTQAGEAASSLASRVGLLGASLGAITIGLATAAAASAAYSAQQKELERSTFGVGRASGATLQTLNDAALAGAAGGTISTSGARDVVASLNATGRIDPKVYADVAANMRDLSKVMGTDIPSATETVTGALAGGIQGFDKLNAVLGLGGAGLREQIKDLYESGRAFEAQRVIVDAYGKRVAEVTEKPGVVQSFLNRFNDFGRNTSDEFSAIGARVSGIFGSGTVEQQLAAARKRVSNQEYLRDAGLGFTPQELSSATAEVAKLEASMKATAQGGKDAKTALTSLTVQPLVESLNPAQKRIDDLRKGAESIDTFLREGGDKLDQSGAARRTMEALRDQARQLADDLSRGGTALADGLRNAQYGLRSVGNSQTGQSLADVQKRAEDARIALERSNPDPSVRAAQTAAIEETRRLEEERVRRETTLNAGASGGAFARAPSNIQSMILDAVKRFPDVDPAILAAVGEKENRFRLTGATQVLNSRGQPATTAYGFGQITDPAEIDIRKVLPGFDKTNPDTAVLGTAAYLSQRIRGAGNLIRGLDGYGTGPGYGLDVLRRAGKLGDVSDEGQARDADARRRSLDSETTALKLATEANGRDADGLRARTETARTLADMQARGIPISKELEAQLGQENAARARIAASGRMLQFNIDSAFERDQVGRTRSDQSAFARARYVTQSNDMTTPEAQRVIAETRTTNDLLDAKNSATSALSGFASDLRNGATAAQAASNALGRLADSVLNKVIDSVVSSAFGSVAKGGIGSLFEFADGGYTGHGARYEPAGIVHRGEYVFDQGSVSRIGVNVLEGMRGGLRGYDKGGLVGWPAGPAAANANARSSAPAIRMGDINISAPGADKEELLRLRAYVDRSMAESRRTIGQQFADWKQSA